MSTFWCSKHPIFLPLSCFLSHVVTNARIKRKQIQNPHYRCSEHRRIIRMEDFSFSHFCKCHHFSLQSHALVFFSVEADLNNLDIIHLMDNFSVLNNTPPLLQPVKILLCLSEYFHHNIDSLETKSSCLLWQHIY